MTRLRLRDGRWLAWRALGAASGDPALFLHGGLSSRLEWPLQPSSVERAGLHLVAPDRPGYGGSSPAPGLSLAGWVEDMDELVRELGWTRFRLFGFSMGGSHALALAALRPQSVTALDAMAPVTPMEIQARAVADGRYTLFRNLKRTFPPLAPVIPGLLRALWRLSPRRYEDEIIRRLSAAEKREYAAALQAQMRNHAEAFRHSSAGIYGDLERLTAPWGVDLRQIRAPVRFWQGDQDTLAPVESGRLLAAQLPDAELRFLAGEGHFFIFEREGQILGEK